MSTSQENAVNRESSEEDYDDNDDGEDAEDDQEAEVVDSTSSSSTGIRSYEEDRWSPKRQTIRKEAHSSLPGLELDLELRRPRNIPMTNRHP